MSYVIGVDVGGTNSDAVIFCGEVVIASAKFPTGSDKTSGIVGAIRAALESLPEERRAYVLGHVARVSIGTTHFLNAVVEENASVLSRVAVIRLCGSASRAVPPYTDFPRKLRDILYGGCFMVAGGREYNGVPIAEIDEEEIRECVREMQRQSPPVGNVVICGVFSPRDDRESGQEARVEAIARRLCPEISCTLSHGIGMLGLIERENAAILNESLKPLAQTTITAFRQALNHLGLTCPFYLTQNDGTLISAQEAMQFPVLTFSSGPTNSMRGAAFLSGLKDAIVIDIGGTSTDVGVLKDGFPREASSQLEVGGVRTNFSMPDVKSISLGGGSRILWDPITRCMELGRSVGYDIVREALAFGGSQCTATDVAIAAGVGPSSICRDASCAEALRTLDPALVYSAMTEMRRRVEEAIDTVKTEHEDTVVILVGGGSILMDCSTPLKGASRVITPAEHGGVANALGAALGTVGGTYDNVVALSQEGGEEGLRQARQQALEQGIAEARAQAIRKGAIKSSLITHHYDVIEVAYVEARVRVQVKVIGTLSDAVVKPQPKPRPPSPDPDRAPVVSPAGGRKDNPHWPFSSAEEAQRDRQAGLTPPTLRDGEWVVSREDCEDLAIGAGILGCGGGGDPNLGRVQAQKMVDEGLEIRVMNPLRVDASEQGLFCPVAFMGAPAIQHEKLVAGGESELALSVLKQALASGLYGPEGDEGRSSVAGVSVRKEGDVWIASCDDLKRVDVSCEAGSRPNRRITGLICAEVGGCNSFEPILLGARTGLPVLDADGMGRAFPELQMYLPLIYGCRAYPSVITDNKGAAVCCSHVDSAKSLEDFFRKECVAMGMSSAIAMGTLTLDEVLSHCVLHSMSQAWQLGRAVRRARIMHCSVINAVTEQQRGTLLITGKVVKLDRVLDAGFNSVVTVVEGLDEFSGHQVKLIAKNEFYIARIVGGTGRVVTDGPVLACTPDLICVIDSDKGFPITTEGIRYGMRVGVIALPAYHTLTTPQALQVVGPAVFGFDIGYRPPQSIAEVAMVPCPHS